MGKPANSPPCAGAKEPQRFVKVRPRPRPKLHLRRPGQSGRPVSPRRAWGPNIRRQTGHRSAPNPPRAAPQSAQVQTRGPGGPAAPGTSALSEHTRVFHPRASSLLFLPWKAGPTSARAPLPHGRPRAPSVLPPGPALPLEALLACLFLCLPLRRLLVALTRHHSWPQTADACPLRLGDTSPKPRGREDRLLLRPRGRVKKVFLWDLFPKGRLCSKHAIDFMNPFVPVYTVGG